MNFKTITIGLAAAFIASYESHVTASPVIRNPLYPTRKNYGLSSDRIIEELVKLDVKELCTRIKERDTLWKIFRSGKPLKSDFFSGSHLPSMCHGVHVAMRNGWTGLVDQYSKYNRCQFDIIDLQELAIYGSHLDYFKLILETRSRKKSFDAGDLYTEFFNYAANNGELNLLQSSLQNVYGSSSAMDWAAANGHLDVVQWLHDERRILLDGNTRSGCSREAMAFAAHHNQLPIVEYLFENCRHENNVIMAINYARCMKNTEIEKFLIAKSKPLESVPTNGKPKHLIRM
jgi:hypothetical protein